MARNKSRRPFLRREVDGVELFRCTSCLGWKKRESFRRNRSAKFGIVTQCKACRKRYEEQHRKDHADEINARNNARYHARRELEREGEERERRGGSYGAMRVRTEFVRPWLQRLYDIEGELLPIATVLRVDQSLLGKILAGTYYDTVPLDLADRIAMEAGAETELWDIVVAPGRDGWGPNGERFCVRCGTFERPHHCRGMCRRCYAAVQYHRQRGHEPPPPRNERWSNEHAQCMVCGTSGRTGTDRHGGKGLCLRCFNRVYRWAETHAETFDERVEQEIAQKLVNISRARENV